jgi:NLI interacting factor-like phosphatase
LQDLDRLGRDIDRIVIVDNSPASYAFHPENAVPVGTWFDDPNDRELLELIPLMEELARCDNIYKVLNSQYDHRMVPPHPHPPQQPQQSMQVVPQMPPPNALPPVVPVTSAQSVPIGVRRGVTADYSTYNQSGGGSTTIGVSESTPGPAVVVPSRPASTLITTTNLSNSVSTIPITIHHAPAASNSSSLQRRSLNVLVGGPSDVSGAVGGGGGGSHVTVRGGGTDQRR